MWFILILEKLLGYYKIRPFAAHYKSVMFYGTGPSTIRFLCAGNFVSLYARMFVTVRYGHPSLIFVGKAKSLLIQWSPTSGPTELINSSHKSLYN